MIQKGFVARTRMCEATVRSHRPEPDRRPMADAHADAAEVLHGMRQGGEGAADEAAAPRARTPRAPGSAAPSVRSEKHKKSPPSGPGAGTPNMSDTKHEEAIKSYTESPELHVVDFAKVKSNCQICGTGRGMRKPGERYQTRASLSCAHCRVNVCGPGCWKLLHGYYKIGKEPEEKAGEFRKAKAAETCEDADDERD